MHPEQENPAPLVHASTEGRPDLRAFESLRLAFHGDGATLFGIRLVNILLTMVTLGVYHFWGKAKVRHYVYAQTELAGDRFAYHGTGKELFFGWLKAVALFVPLLGVALAPMFLMEEPTGQIISNLLFYGSILALLPLIIVGSMRFRLARTSWRGIRFSFRGKTTEFLKLYWGGTLLTVVTLGFYAAWHQVKIRRYLTAHTRFGTEPFEFDGEPVDLFKEWLLALVLTPLTLGIYGAWFQAWKHRYLWNHTHVAGGRFRSTVQGGDLFVLHLVNGLLVLCTLGIAAPWAFARTQRFVLAHLTLDGPVDLDRVVQDAQAASATGEGMEELLDVGVLDLELGL